MDPSSKKMNNLNLNFCKFYFSNDKNFSSKPADANYSFNCNDSDLPWIISFFLSAFLKIVFIAWHIFPVITSSFSFSSISSRSVYISIDLWLVETSELIKFVSFKEFWFLLLRFGSLLLLFKLFSIKILSFKLLLF